MTTLAADIVTTCKAIYGDRFYRMRAPEGIVAPRTGIVLPYGVFQKISGANIFDLDGPASLMNARIQIDSFGPDSDEIDLIVEAVKTAMANATLFKSIEENEIDQFEDPQILYRVMLDFSVWRP